MQRRICRSILLGRCDFPLIFDCFPTETFRLRFWSILRSEFRKACTKRMQRHGSSTFRVHYCSMGFMEKLCTASSLPLPEPARRRCRCTGWLATARAMGWCLLRSIRCAIVVRYFVTYVLPGAGRGQKCGGYNCARLSGG